MKTIETNTDELREIKIELYELRKHHTEAKYKIEEGGFSQLEEQ